MKNVKKLLLLIALFPGIACAEQKNLNYTTKTDWGKEGPKVQSNFTELYTNKEPSVYVGETAPADTTKLFLDSNEEAGVLVQKKYVTGTGWVRVGSHGVQYATNCASITAGMCVDTDDGKLYYHNGTAVVEVGTGGSGTTYTAGTGIDITSGVISSTVTGTLPPGTEGQGLQKGASAWEAVDYAPLAFSGKVVRDTGTGLVSIVTDSSPTNGSANFLTSDAIYDALAGKEPADSTIVKVAEIDTQAEFEEMVGWSLPSGRTGGYVLALGAKFKSTAVSGATTYVGLTSTGESSSSYARAATPVPISGSATVAYSYVSTSDAQPATGSQVCTLYINGVASSMAITIPSSGSGMYTSTGTASVSAGNSGAWACVNNATAAAGTVNSIVISVQP